MTNAFIPYGIYWSTPFAKWQGSIAHLNSIRLAANCGRRMLDDRQVDAAAIDLGILGITNPQLGSFYGLPWLTGLMGIDRVAGPTIQQACASSARALQMAAQEIGGGTARCALIVTADRCSNGPVVHYPDPTAPGGNGHTEKWVMDNFGHDPYAKNAMIDTAENVARRFKVGTAEMNETVLRRYQQYLDALANDREFQKRYMQDVAITDAGFRKQSGTLSEDEGIFPTTAEGLAKLKPVKPDGTVTFGTQTPPLPFLEAISGHVFGEIWTRPGLDQRSRRWLTLVGVAESNREVPMKTHFYAALTSGNCTVAELHEFVLHYASLGGWHKASSVLALVFEMAAKIEKGLSWDAPIGESGE